MTLDREIVVYVRRPWNVATLCMSDDVGSLSIVSDGVALLTSASQVGKKLRAHANQTTHLKQTFLHEFWRKV